MKRYITTCLMVIAMNSAMAQQPAGYRVAKLTTAQQKQTIDSIVKTINDRYIFPEVAKKIEVHLRTQLARKAYSSITDGESFANAVHDGLCLTKDFSLG